MQFNGKATARRGWCISRLRCWPTLHLPPNLWDTVNVKLANPQMPHIDNAHEDKKMLSIIRQQVLMSKFMV